MLGNAWNGLDTNSRKGLQLYWLAKVVFCGVNVTEVTMRLVAVPRRVYSHSQARFCWQAVAMGSRVLSALLGGSPGAAFLSGSDLPPAAYLPVVFISAAYALLQLYTFRTFSALGAVLDRIQFNTDAWLPPGDLGSCFHLVFSSC